MLDENTKPLIKLRSVDIQRFRRLHCVRVDIENDTTILVGANNSGKTAFLDALDLFLLEQRFTVCDISLQEWDRINNIGEECRQHLRETVSGEDVSQVWSRALAKFLNLMPMLDLWFDVREGGFHFVAPFLPSLRWRGGLIGIRLRLEPIQSVAALRDLISSYDSARKAVENSALGGVATAGGAADVKKRSTSWPSSFYDFLCRRWPHDTKVGIYKLDPEKRGDAASGRPSCQSLDDDAQRISKEYLDRLVQVNYIGAQRGLGKEARGRSLNRPGMFSRQLMSFLKSHLDLRQLQNEAISGLQNAISEAQAVLDSKINEALSPSVSEIQKLGYPSFQQDPQGLEFRTSIDPSSLLNHDAAVQYRHGEDGTNSPSLPETSIGLGYQNLQSMSYHLVDFRKRRMESATGEGKAKPVHLVLLEEPEAHLHVQAQKIFVEQSYKLLQVQGSELATQLIISSHSSHLVHSGSFTSLRYFYRVPRSSQGEVPSTLVLTLKDVFGEDKDTVQFVERYLQIKHSDLLFADAVIVVEGLAERLLIPMFIERFFPELASRYISLLEIGGSHAHRLEPLFRRLKIPVLIFTDLDPAKKANGKLVRCSFSKATSTRNPSLRHWFKAHADQVKRLCSMNEERKLLRSDERPEGNIRVAFQLPGKIAEKDLDKVAADEEAAVQSDHPLPVGGTFEDALVLENLDYFRKMTERSGRLEAWRTWLVA